MEAKIKNSAILEGDRAEYHFTLHNIDYEKQTIEKEIEKDTKIYNYNDYINFVSEIFEQKTETKWSIV